MARNLTKGEKRLNKILTAIAWIFILIGFGAVAWFYFFTSTHVNTNDAQVRQYITPVSSRVSGYITAINFEENLYVNKGDTLIVIDNREFKNDIIIAQADLESTDQSVDTYVKAVESEASEAAVIDAEIEAAKIEVWRAEKDYNRFKNLVEEDAATVQQFEKIEAKYKEAKAALMALQNRKTVVSKKTTKEETKIAPVKTQISQKQAQLNNAKLNYSYSYIVAPCDGWVGVKNIQVGQLIKADQGLVQIVSKEKWIVANFKETQMGEIDPSQPILIKADAYPNIEFWGRLESLSPASGSEFSLVKPDNATGNFIKIEQRFPIKIILEKSNDIDKLLSGMNVIVSAEKIKN